MSRARTFETALRESGGATTGFDYLRLALAIYVFVFHCISFADPQHGQFVWENAFGPIHRAVLPMFFALSGFLVAGSYARNSTLRFVMLRAVRIVPALAVETAFCAILIGVAFTTLPLGDYLRSPEFWSYFLNIVGDVHFQLPGVFDGMRINSQLWTLPLEFECYFCLILLSLTRLARRRDLCLVLILAIGFVMTVNAVAKDLINTGPAAPRLVLVLAFLSGVVLNMYKERVPQRGDLLAACALASYAFLCLKNLAFLAPLPVAYVTVFIGLARPPRLQLGDISYGIYLFHSPILCTLVWVIGERATTPILFAAGLPLTLALAWLSWTFVENPILRRKAAIVEPVERLFAALVQRFALWVPAWRPANAQQPES